MRTLLLSVNCSLSQCPDCVITVHDLPSLLQGPYVRKHVWKDHGDMLENPLHLVLPSGAFLCSLQHSTLLTC